MIRIIAVTNDLRLLKDITIDRLAESDIKWYWVDFNTPTEEENILLKTHFNFHPLAIEDCLHFQQRPKLDYYEGYDFYVLHTFKQNSFVSEEVDIFVGHNFIVTFHLSDSNEIELVRNKVIENKNPITKGVMYIFHLILDEIVDDYFPKIYQIEDKLNQIETKKTNQDIIKKVYKIRAQLLKLRRTIFPMSELLYRIINSERIKISKEERFYFKNIQDHLIKLSEMIENNREMTADIRDNYISYNSYKMNAIMKTLTIMSSIFIPLTFIAGIYGMNFEYMPELSWRWGYFTVLGVMAAVGSGMLLFLWRKGWFK